MFRVGVARCGGQSFFSFVRFWLRFQECFYPIPLILKMHVNKHARSRPSHTHTHAYGARNDSSARLRARGPELVLCGLSVCEYVEGSAKKSGQFLCVCVSAWVRVCGLGVWSLARAWGEPADGWDEKRAAVFTLLWGLCMDTGTLPRPFSVTALCTRARAHSLKWCTPSWRTGTMSHLAATTPQIW